MSGYQKLLVASVAIALAAAVLPMNDACPENEFSVDVDNLPYASSGLHQCQYAGTLKTDTTENNLFFWFFRHSDEKKPLLIWIEGGPGSSGLFGLFVLNGPLNVTKFGSGDDDFNITSKQSFSEDYHVLYLDQPVMTGFSYGDSVSKDMEAGAEDFMEFLHQFLDVFDMKTNSLLLLGESYAGKFVPLFTSKILDYNAKADLSDNIILQAVIVNDPYVSPELQRTNMHVVGAGLNILDETSLNQISALQQRCQAQHAKNVKLAKNTCSAIMDYIHTVSGDVEGFDARIFDYDWVGQEDFIALMTTSGKKEDIYKALHVDASTKNPKFQQMPASVGDALASDNMVDYSAYYQKILDSKVPIIVMAGEFDMQDGAASQDLWIKQLIDFGDDDLYFDDRFTYYYNDSQGNEKVGGYYRGTVWESTLFTILTVPKAGHFLDHNNYELSKSVLDDMATNGKLNRVPKSDVSDYMCSAMKECHGSNGYCNGNGQCICMETFYGADCSYDSFYFYKDQADSYKQSTSGTEWFYSRYQLHYIPPRGSLEAIVQETDYKKMEFVIQSTEAPFNLYVGLDVGHNPNQFTNDFEIKNWKQGRDLVISADTLVFNEGTVGPVLAVEVLGFNHTANTPIDSVVTIQLREKVFPADVSPKLAFV